MIRRALALLAVLSALLAPLAPAVATPIPYYTGPVDSVQNALNTVVQSANAAIPTANPLQLGTSSSGAVTINGAKGTITTESLSTAAGAVFTETLTDSSIAANSIVLASVGFGTDTTGTPDITTVTPAAGSAVIKVQNIHASAALNGTLTISFLVIN